MGKYTPEQLNDFSKEQIISLFCTLQDQLDQTNQNLDRLIEQIRLAQQNRFGRRAEKIDQIAGQMSLFNEAEEYADPDIPEPDADKVLIKVIVKKPKQKGKRQEDFKDLPQEEIHHRQGEISPRLPDKRVCPDGQLGLGTCHPAVYDRKEELGHH